MAIFKTLLLFVLSCCTLHADRIGLLFGNFDPMHRGHASILDQSVEQLALDRVYVIPYYETDNENSEIFLVRWNLLRHALEGNDKYKLLEAVKLEEFGQKQKLLKESSFFFEDQVLDTIRMKEGWDQKYFHIMGTDEFIKVWRANRFPSVAEPRALVVIKRKGYDQTVPRKLRPQLGRKLFLLDFKIPRISAGKIRGQFLKGVKPEGLRPRVLKQIEENQYYGYQSR